MFQLIPWLIAAVTTALCLFLWFKDIKKTMQNRKYMVESAYAQLLTCHQKAISSHHSPEDIAVLKQSEKIYSQSVDIYNKTINKPWVYIPSAVMGIKPVKKEDIKIHEGGTEK